MTTITLNALPEILDITYANNINLFITGRPGIGKTSCINEFAQKQFDKDPEFKLFAFYAPTMTPIDIQATMPDQETGRLKFYNNEALPNAYNDPDVHGIIFFGELPNADPTVVKSLQKYMNGEDLNGCLRKPDGLRVVVDGNRLEDRSGVLQQARAFLSRFMHVEIEPIAEQNIQYMIQQNWHPLVIGFLQESPALIDKYDEVFKGTVEDEARKGIWASMRSWNRVSDVEWWAEKSGQHFPMIFLEGNVGTSVAAQYLAYKEVLSKLPTKEEVLAAPDSIELPTEISQMYALTVMIALRVTEQELTKALVFWSRLPAELRVMAARVILMNPTLKTKAIGNQSFMKFISSPEMKNILF